MSLRVDGRPVVTPSMAYEEKEVNYMRNKRYIKELISGYNKEKNTRKDLNIRKTI